jgi:aspartyl-tRNA(Asn)/glutamyl-tRNA(Gln) amidotransferase subunit B
MWIGICDGNMQEGSFRCDANVSVRKPGAPLGTRREIKNLNSFKFMQQAIDFEVRWQIEQIEDGHAIQQATVLFDPDTGETRAMRTKEDAADYRYFPDPDLPPLVIAPEWVEARARRDARAAGPMAQRFVPGRAARVRRADADAEPGDGALLRGGGDACGQPKLVSNWIMGEISRRLNAAEQTIEQAPVGAALLAALINALPTARFPTMRRARCSRPLWNRECDDVDALIEAKGLKQMSDSGALEANRRRRSLPPTPTTSVEEFRAGKDKAFNALVGQIMKASKGKANPQMVNDVLRRKLG